MDVIFEIAQKENSVKQNISTDLKIKLLGKIKLLFILIHHIQNIFVNPYLYQVNMSISVRVYI